MDDMIITIRNKLPEVPRGLILVGENTGLTLQFDCDDEWSGFQTKTARVCIGSARTDIEFSGDTVELPLIPSSVRYIDVGVYAGDLSTTAPARIRVAPSILGISQGSGTYDPDSPDVLPAAEDVTLDDLVRMNDVSAGKWVKATIRQILEKANAVTYSEQTLTPIQRLRARNNINALNAMNVKLFEGDDPTNGVDYAYPILVYQMLTGLNAEQHDVILQFRVEDPTLGEHNAAAMAYFSRWSVPDEVPDANGRYCIAQTVLCFDGVPYVYTLEGLEDPNDSDFGSRWRVTYEQLSGIQGSKGDKGDTGAQGPKGDKGDTGAQGPAGPSYDDTVLSGKVTALEDGVVRHDTVQDLNDRSKLTARTNIDALAANGNAYRALSIPMGACDSTSTSTAFTATVDGITELRDGVVMCLTNGVVTSAAGYTININGLGAKPVYASNAAATASTTAFNAAYTVLFIYNSSRVTGGCWDYVYGYDSNTTYTPPKLGFGYAECSTAAATAAKTATISSYALTTGGFVAIRFANDVPANATLNITSKGAKAIYYKGTAITAGVIKAGDTVTMIYSTYYHVLSIDRDEAPVSSVNGQTGDVTLAIPSTAEDVGAAPAIVEVTVSSVGAVTQALDAGKIYHFTGALTSLTITLNAASGVIPQYHFDFTEGSTAFDPILPSGVKLPSGHTWEADTRYEVDILNNYAVVVGWAVMV